MSTVATLPIPGWYDDPSDPNGLRWWTGESWSAYTNAKAPVAPDPGYDYGYGSVPPVADDEEELLVPPGPSTTPGVWLLAILPLLHGASLALSILGLRQTGWLFPGWITFLLLLGIAWTAAALDIRALRLNGHRPPSILWMLLLPPLAYLIARGRMLRAQKARAWPPEVLYFAGVVLTGIAIFALTPALAGMGVPGYQPPPMTTLGEVQPETQPETAAPSTVTLGPLPEDEEPTAQRVQQLVGNGLAPHGSYMIDCSDAASVIARPSDFACLAIDTATGEVLPLLISIDEAGLVHVSPA